MIDVILSYYIHPESDCAFVDIKGQGGKGDGNVMEIGDVEPDSTAAVKVPTQLDFEGACLTMGMQPPYYRLDAAKANYVVLSDKPIRPDQSFRDPETGLWAVCSGPAYSREHAKAISEGCFHWPSEATHAVMGNFIWQDARVAGINRTN